MIYLIPAIKSNSSHTIIGNKEWNYSFGFSVAPPDSRVKSFSPVFLSSKRNSFQLQLHWTDWRISNLKICEWFRYWSNDNPSRTIKEEELWSAGKHSSFPSKSFVRLIYLLFRAEKIFYAAAPISVIFKKTQKERTFKWVSCVWKLFVRKGYRWQNKPINGWVYPRWHFGIIKLVSLPLKKSKIKFAR